MEAQPSIEDFAHACARVASEAFAASARYLRALPEDAWSEPTGCARWDMRALAGHIVGEAVWFPNVVRGVTRGEAPLPNRLYEELKLLPPQELADRIEEAAAAIRTSVEGGDHQQLLQPVDLGWVKLPLWQATAVSAWEGVLHDWDTRARREPRAAIPTAWAQTVAPTMPQFAPVFAHRDGIRAAPGVYLLMVGDRIGPMTVTARNGRVTVEEGEGARPDVTLHLSADQYVRLLTGRLDLSSPEGREVQIEGDRDRAKGLNRIFAGIAN